MSRPAIAEMLAELRRIHERLDALTRPAEVSPVAVKRKDAARLLGISLRKLELLIVAGRLRTAEDVRLIPMAEVKRYCAPKAKRQRRRLGGHRVRRSNDGQSDEALDALKARLRAKAGP